MEEHNPEHEQSVTTTAWIEQEVRRLKEERDMHHARWQQLKEWVTHRRSQKEWTTLSMIDDMMHTLERSNDK